MTRALVVDDKDENVHYLRALLEAHGFTVDSAQHGTEALFKARQALPDVVISDLLMPVMDGFTLLRHWKADAALNRIPFVVYTATYTGVEDRDLALRLGADAFILKPAEPEEFLARIRQVQAQPSAALPPPPQIATASTPAGPENALLHLYSETLIRKLEEKTRKLEEANRTLGQDQAELSMRDRAIQAVSQGIIISDATLPDVPIVYVSPSFERLTGYLASDALGKSCRFLQGPETDPSVVAEIRRALQERQGCTVELLNYRKDGTRFWNHLTISPVVDPGGQLTHFVGIQTDVTERRQLESELRQAQKMEAVGLLAAGVAHDFNNIISVVLLYTSFVQNDSKLPESLRNDIDEVRRAGERAADLTRQLLAFSRQQVLQPRVLDLSQVIRGTEKMLRRLLGEDVELSLHAAPSVGKVLADPSQLEQVVMNLAVNARDAMPRGGKLTIEIANAELRAGGSADYPDVPAGAYVVLRITDTGEGMDDQTRERIFEPFFTTKEQGKGTGLGLSTVFGIVKQSGGHIRVSSAPGLGTTFEILVPRAEGSGTLAPSNRPVAAQVPGTETILLVEDDEQVRGVIRTTLRRHGYDVLEAQNGGEAFLICEKHTGPIHLLLTDVVMPYMNGEELSDRLSKVRSDMKVLFISGYTQSAIVDRGVLAPDIAFLQKPMTRDALLGKVREVLDSPAQSVMR